MPAILPPHVLPPTAVLLPSFAPWFDVAGLAVFAASGALAAARRGQTFVTLAFFALITGVGGDPLASGAAGLSRAALGGQSRFGLV